MFVYTVTAELEYTDIMGTVGLWFDSCRKIISNSRNDNTIVSHKSFVARLRTTEFWPICLNRPTQAFQPFQSNIYQFYNELM